MNKQIEEMAKDICRRELDPNCVTCYFQDKNCRDLILSEALYNKGYRKESDVVMGIFEQVMQAIEKGVAEGHKTITNSAEVIALREVLLYTGEVYAGYIGKSICEVFKKYESEGMQND